MTTVELYKRFRPKKWGGLIGQEKAAQSLKRMVAADAIPTSLLFSGPRGCGKTSAAWVMAKAINCENPQAGDPCNSCDTCLNIDEGKQMGVTYVSMANQGGVDNVRELMNQARLNQPLKRQVFILDEVHNLSKAAFDSILIPIESENMPALFIFCTTEIHKVPDTILSRMQQRRFFLVPEEKMRAYLLKVAKAASLTPSEEQVTAAVRSGRGSVRDTLTALDTIIATEEITTSWGSRLLEALASRSELAVLTVISEAANDSMDFRAYSEQLFEDLRNLLLVQAKVSRDLAGPPVVENEEKVLKGLGGKTGLLIYLQEVGDSITQAALGVNPRIRLELTLLRALAKLNKLAKAREAQGR